MNSNDWPIGLKSPLKFDQQKYRQAIGAKTLYLREPALLYGLYT